MAHYFVNYELKQMTIKDTEEIKLIVYLPTRSRFVEMEAKKLAKQCCNLVIQSLKSEIELIESKLNEKKGLLKEIKTLDDTNGDAVVHKANWTVGRTKIEITNERRNKMKIKRKK